jgi:hypothetical protein
MISLVRVGDERRPWDITSRYVERFYTPLVGPGAIAVSRLAVQLVAEAGGHELGYSQAELCRMVGVTNPSAAHKLIEHAIRWRFAAVDGDLLAFYSHVGWLTTRHAERLPTPLYEQHTELRERANAAMRAGVRSAPRG